MSSTNPVRAAAAGVIRAEMARRRLTSTDLASALNCSQSSASRRMTGEVGLSLDEVAVIAEWLGIVPAALLEASAA